MRKSHHSAFAGHVCHRWGRGWRCWKCARWGSDLRMRPCRSTSEVSLAYVPRSRRCTVEEMRDRAEEGEW